MGQNRNEDIFIQVKYYDTHCSSNQQEQTSLVWRGKVNADGCNAVKDERKETKRKTNIVGVSCNAHGDLITTRGSGV